MYNESFSTEELDAITELHLKEASQYRTVQGETVVRYLDKEFICLPNVVWPGEDSMGLLEAFTVCSNKSVLDMGTGSGVLGVMAALRGAGKVVALDLNEAAIANAKKNADLHGVTGVVDARLSDVFDALESHESFDVVLANFPYRNKKAANVLESLMWDTELSMHKKFFQDVKKYIKPDGKIYFAQANYGAADEALAMAREQGFQATLVAKKEIPEDRRIYYSFLLELE